MDTTIIIDKLQKLLNHERSARTIGNVAEAEAFAAKVAELLFTHKLSMSEVEMEAEEVDEPVAQERVDGLRAPWASILAMGVSTASFCKAIRSQTGFIFIGRPTDRFACVSLFRYLSVLGTSLCATELAKYKRSAEYTFEKSFRPGIAKTWKACFLRGYANAVYHRLAGERKALTAQAQSSGTSLVYIGKSEAAIAAYVGQAFPQLRKGRTPATRFHKDAYASGLARGQAVSLKSSASLSAGR
jgi:hypothetical protein